MLRGFSLHVRSSVRSRPIADTSRCSHAAPMIAFRCVLTLALVSVATSSASVGAACPLAKVGSARELLEVLSLRAVEVVELAAHPGDGDARLAALVAPSASFSLGAGDVGRRLGTGVEGARALARMMKADTYLYLGWDYMDGPVDGCSSQKVTVDFVDSRNKSLSRVDFTFDAGRLVDATGWSRSFESGDLKGALAR